MLRILAFLYGMVAYAAFLVAIAYMILFLGYHVLPKSAQRAIYDRPLYTTEQFTLEIKAADGKSGGPADQAVVVDLLLLAAFAVSHSLMARPTFKRFWTKICPQPIERSTYVLVSAVVLVLLFQFWQPIHEVIPGWQFSPIAHPNIVMVFQVLYWFGWALVFLSTLMINHFDLFGLRQVWCYLRGVEYKPLEFRVSWLYRLVRHPLMLGFLIVLWATPTMILGRLLFAAGMSLYIVVGILLEERNLATFHGEAYTDYQRRTSMLLPLRWKRG